MEMLNDVIYKVIRINIERHIHPQMVHIQKMKHIHTKQMKILIILSKLLQRNQCNVKNTRSKRR